jgi:hypothetical protein
MRIKARLEKLERENKLMKQVAGAMMRIKARLEKLERENKLMKQVALTAFCALYAVCAVAQTAISADGVVESTSGGFKFPDGTVQATAAAPGSAPVEDTGQQKCWDTAGTEILCSDPLAAGQDGKLQRGVDWPTPRFTDNLDGTVTDNLTGLIWLRDANCISLSPDNWANALTAANTLSPGICGLIDGSAAGDWRLPNIKELLSLVDYSQSSPALPSGHPFVSVQSSSYWSSTTYASDTGFAWIVLMFNGNVNFNSKPSNLRVWPVRGGQ